MSSHDPGDLSKSPPDNSIVSPNAAGNLTEFQLNLLVTLGHKSQNGLGVKDDLEEYYEEEVNHNRLYPNLDKLVSRGYVDKGQLNGRTNIYRLTRAGRQVLAQRRDRINAALEAHNSGEEARGHA